MHIELVCHFDFSFLLWWNGENGKATGGKKHEIYGTVRKKMISNSYYS